MYIAAHQGHESVVRLFLEKNVDPNTSYKDYLTPLHAAVQKGHYEIVNLLLQYGAEVNPTITNSSNFSTPLLASLHRGDERIIYLLLNHGAEVNVKLDTISRNCSTDLERLLTYGDYLESEVSKGGSKCGYTPLHFAVELRNENIVKMLLNRKANVNIASNESLLKFRADPNGQCENLRALGIAVDIESENLVQHLLEYGADPNTRVNYSEPVLLSAIVKKNLAIVDLLLKYNALVNEPLRYESRDFETRSNYKNNSTPLHVAIRKSTPEIVQLLLKKGAMVDVETEDFPLHTAIERGEEEIICSLIRHGASVNSVCKKKKTPLVHAVENNLSDCVKLLLMKGASLEIKDSKEKSLLHLALDHGASINLIKILVLSGIDVDARNAKGTALSRVLQLYSRKYSYTSNDEESIEEVDDDYEDDSEEISDSVNYESENEVDFIEDYDDKDESSDGNIKMEEEYENLIIDVNDKDENEVEDKNHINNLKIIQNINVKRGNINEDENVTEDENLIIDLDKGEDSIENSDDDAVSIEAESLNEDDIEDESANDSRDLKLIKLFLAFDADVKDFEHENGVFLHNCISKRNIKALELLLRNGANINFLNSSGNTPLKTCITRSGRLNLSPIAFLITQEIAKREATNDECIHGQNLELLKIERLNLFYRECKEEIKNMKLLKISNNLTYFDILVENRNKLAIWFRNKNLMKLLKSAKYLEQFPLYGKCLKAQIKDGKRRNLLLELSLQYMNKALEFQFPRLIVDEIFSYLSCRDLRNLCIAYNPGIFLK